MNSKTTGQILLFPRPAHSRGSIPEKLRAQAAQMRLAEAFLSRAIESGREAMNYLEAALHATPDTQDFCRRCQDAFSLDDLDAMIRERDLLSAELAERRAQ